MRNLPTTRTSSGGSSRRPGRSPGLPTRTWSPSTTRAPTGAPCTWPWSTCPAAPCGPCCTSAPRCARARRSTSSRASCPGWPPRTPPGSRTVTSSRRTCCSETAQSVKVADFGLARLLSDVTHTKSGLLIGTAAYLAPEQVAGGRADFRTDVYATGIMLFELLTGRQPFTGDTPLAVAYRHVNEVVPAPSSLVPGLPPALDSLVALATSRNPDLRPADAGQFLRAITGTRHGLPLDVPPPAPYGAAPGALPGAAPGLPGAAAGLPGGAHGHDASSADTAPPRAVVAPVWPAPPPADWPAQPSASPPAEWPAQPPGAPSGGWPQMPAAGWPDPAQNGNDLDMIPGMATGTAVQPYGVAGADPYRPATNQTLIVSASERSVRDHGAGIPASAAAVQPQARLPRGRPRRGAGVRPARLVDDRGPVHDRAQGHRGLRGDGPGRPARRRPHPGCHHHRAGQHRRQGPGHPDQPGERVPDGHAAAGSASSCRPART